MKIDEIIAEVIAIVRVKKKNIGMRMIYKRFKVPKENRQQWCELWDAVKGELNACNKQKTTANDGNSRTSPRATIRKK